MENSQYTKRYFSFNLIPPKSTQEVEVLVERDSTLLYSFLLIFFGTLVFFILTIIQSSLVEPALEASKNNNIAIQSQIENFNDVRAKYGELFIKARSLEPILGKDVKVTKILDIESEIRNQFPNLIEVGDYRRRQDGRYSLGFDITDPTRVVEIVDFLGAKSDVSEIFLENVDWSGDGSFVSISFLLSNI